MAKLSIVQGTTSKLLKVFIQDSSVTTGSGLTGLTSGSSGLTCYYILEGANATVAVSLSGGTLGTWSSGGFIVVDQTHCPGLYELGIPNAALTGAKSVVVYLQGATNMVPCVLEIELTAVDNQNATTYGMGAIPNATAGAAGGLFIAGTNAATTITSAGGNALTLSSTGTNGAGLAISGNGSGNGMLVTGGATGNGLSLVGGATSGAGLKAVGTAGNSAAMQLVGQGSAAGLLTTGGATGAGISANGGATSGAGITATAATSGDGITATAAGNANGLTVTKAGTGVNTNITSDVWNEINTGATHNVANSTGKQLRTLSPGSSDVIRTGTAQAGGASTITLDAGASAVDNAYQFDIISLTSGTGAGQSKWISSYVGSTKVATVNSAWNTPPDNTSVFEITPTSVSEVISYATGQDPGTLVANQVLGTSPWATTKISDAMKAAWSQGVGKWAVTGTTLNLYAPDGTTVLKAFTLDSSTAPTSRT